MTSPKKPPRQQVGLSPRECPTCGETFTPYRDYQRACSRKCRERLGPANDVPHAKRVEYVCAICGSQASAVSTVGSGKFLYCQDCKSEAERRKAERHNAARRERWRNDPEYRERVKSIGRRSKYGITAERYAQMLKQQSGVCAICAQPPDPDGVRSASRLHVDHDHDTGMVRRLLCLKCNRGIGYFADNPELLETAAHYLRTFGR